MMEEFCYDLLGKLCRFFPEMILELHDICRMRGTTLHFVNSVGMDDIADASAEHERVTERGAVRDEFER